MASLTLQSSRGVGRAIAVGNAACRQAILAVLAREGQTAFETDCPYQAMAELSRKPQGYRMVVLSLQSLYREELEIITAIKAHCAEVDVWLAQTDGRAGALADALRLGAAGIMDDNGLHRLSAPAEKSPAPTVEPAVAPPAAEPVRPAEPARQAASWPEEPVMSVSSSDDPVLTADELRALLQEPPA